jgi:hypothetical protein
LLLPILATTGSDIHYWLHLRDMPMSITIQQIKHWFWEHIFEVLVTALVSLVAGIGTYFLTAIKGDVEDLQCRMATYGATTEFHSIQLKFVVVPLEDVQRASDYYKTLVNVISGYQKPLTLCEEGKRLLSDIKAYRDGLDAFIDRDWAKALDKFQSISARTTLSEKSVATVLFHQYLSYKEQNNPKASELSGQIQARLASAHALASAETDYSVKERAIEYLTCDQSLVSKDDQKAQTCLEDLVTRGHDNYVVFYNLSALSARAGNFDGALAQMTRCVKAPGAYSQRRADIEADPDFKALLADPSYGPKFEKLIASLQP